MIQPQDGDVTKDCTIPQDNEYISSFWKKVDACKHENKSPTYFEYISCGTPYCGGHEVRCADCGVYISECGCRSNDGMSGWPWGRWLALERKQLERIREKNRLEVV